MLKVKPEGALENSKAIKSGKRKEARTPNPSTEVNQKSRADPSSPEKDGNWLVNHRMAGPRIEQQLEYMDRRTAGNKSF